jgi:hypothetical protein
MSSTNRGATRHPSDFYPTPPSAIASIMAEIDWAAINTVLEPACGDGRIIDNVIRCKRSVSVEWAEINTRNKVSRDYLKTEYDRGYDLVITNPPFSLAMPFIEKALRDGDNVAMLLRLGFLGSQKRKEFWKWHPVHRLFVLSKRPSFTGGGTDSSDYAWFCWGPDFIRPRGVYSV